MKHLHQLFRKTGLRGYSGVRRVPSSVSISIHEVKRFTRHAPAASAKVGAMSTNQNPELSDADREIYINQCGLMMQQAVAQGRCDLARHWLAQQTSAIFQRSPEQEARMIAEIDRRIRGDTDLTVATK
jgi:hypothetical protein